MKKLISMVFVLALIVGMIPSLDYAVDATDDTISNIRILEVQPTNSYVLNPSTLKGNNKNANVLVDKMPMSLFIANRDKLNGKYDIIYFGQKSGTYVQYHDASLLYRNNQGNKMFIASSFVPNSIGGTNGTKNKYNVSEYLSPNDITHLMASEVSEFLASGQPVVFDKSIFDSSKSTILKNTFKSVNQNNKIISSNVTDQFMINVINNLLADNYTKKPQLKVTTKPVDFSDSQKYLVKEEDRYMRFNLSVSNTDSTHNYKANLYLDLDSNNIFEENKGELVKSEAIYNENLDNVLIKYNLPKQYIGYVSWKVEIVDLNTGAKSYKLGNSAFKYPDNSTKEGRHIRVLQITPNSGNNYNLNSLDSYLKSVDGLYDIQIDVISVGNYNKNPYDLNGRYDMVVLGFCDSLAVNMQFNQTALNRLQSFIDSGQSLLTTHDQFWFMLSDKDNGKMSVTKAFRDRFGQNIYNKDYINSNSVSSNSTMLPYPNGFNGVGFSDRTIKRAFSGLPTTSKALKTNDGQVNSFPFELGNQINISTTHFQYYKLDMERKDLFVWYTLYGSGYNGLDPRNDYYVYSIGNITYSGTGHAKPGNSRDEKILFANTMIKASRTANHAPTLEVEGLTDGFTYYKTQTGISFYVTAEDIDLTDNSTSLKVYIDSNKDGVGDLLVTNIDDFANSKKQQIQLDKSRFNNLDNFNIIIEATDDRGAKSIYTATDIKNIDDSTLVVSQNTTWSNHDLLIGDRGSLDIALEKTGTGNIDFKDITLTVKVKKSDMDSVCNNSIIDGWNVPTFDNASGSYVYTKSITSPEDTTTFSPLFDKGIGELTPEISISYTKFDTIVTNTSALSTLTVNQGQFIVSAIDRYNRPIVNQSIRISKDGTTNTVKTKTDNIITSVNSGSGSYTVSYDLNGHKDKYKTTSLLVTYADGSKKYFEKPADSDIITATVDLDSSNSPADISLVLYEDTIDGISINGDIDFITADGIWQTQDTTVTAIDTTSHITASYKLDKNTKRVEIVFDDTNLKRAIASGTGHISYGNPSTNGEVILVDKSDVPVNGANIVYNSENNSYVITSNGNHFAPGVYKLKFDVKVPKNMHLTSSANSILVKSIVTDVYVDSNSNGSFEDNELFTGIENMLNRPINITNSKYNLKDFTSQKSGDNISLSWALGNQSFADSIFDKFIVEEAIGDRITTKDYPINTFSGSFTLDPKLGDRTYKVYASGPNGVSDSIETTFKDALNDLKITGLRTSNKPDGILLSWEPIVGDYDQVKIVETVGGVTHEYLVESNFNEFEVPLNNSITKRDFKVYAIKSNRTSNPSSISWDDGKHSVTVNQVSGETGKLLGSIVKLGTPGATLTFNAAIPKYKVEGQNSNDITVTFGNDKKVYNVMYIEDPESPVSDKSSWPNEALESIKKYAREGTVDFYDDTYYEVTYGNSADKDNLVSSSLLDDFMRILKNTGAENIRDVNGPKYLEAILDAGDINNIGDLNKIIKEVNGPISYANMRPDGSSYKVLDENKAKISHDSKFGVVIELIVEDNPLYDPVLTCSLNGNQYLVFENPAISLYAVSEDGTETKISSRATITYDAENYKYKIMLVPTNLPNGYLAKGRYYAKINTKTLVNSDNYTVQEILALNTNTKDNNAWEIGYYIDSITVGDGANAKKITDGLSMYINIDYKTTSNGDVKQSRSDDISVLVISKTLQDGGYIK